MYNLIVVAGDSIYLDNNASTLLLPEVSAYLSRLIIEPLANPSSPHSWGTRARALIEEARTQVADALGAISEQIYLLSSGSEANNMALAAALKRLPVRQEIVISTVEHSSILSAAQLLAQRGMRIIELGVDQDGLINLAELSDVVSERTALVSIQFVNNETGVIQPVQQACEIAHNKGALFHSDVAQAFGKMPLDVDASGFDLATVTAHKINGPQGCGALYARSRKYLAPVIGGGDQEHGLRGGTENVLGIAAFGLAADIRHKSLNDSITLMNTCRDRFESTILDQLVSVAINGVRAQRVCNTTNLRFREIDGRMLVADLDRRGIFCSQNSACSSQSPRPSHVLRAMGLDDSEAYESVRFSFGIMNTEAEADKAASIVVESFAELRNRLRQIHSSHGAL